jgi:POT family proton-dependent oligopeptide transporter
MAKDPGNEIQDPRTGAADVVGDGHSGTAVLAAGDQWFGHPRGLSTLFFTEMWERFSYYGMRAILVLFMTTAIVGTNAGLGLQVGVATAVYGLYTFFVYVLSLPGGWVADNIWGQKKAVFVGGVIIMLGHVSLAVPTAVTFYLGLALVVVGTGLLKPNVSTMVGDLYPEGGARRDAGFSIFYMGINIGAFAGTALVGLVGENYNFHWGFSLAAVGMFFGLVQYRLGWHHLGTAGDLRTDDPPEVTARKSRRFYAVSAAVTGAALLLAFLIYTGLLPLTIQAVAGVLGTSVALLAVVYFASLMQERVWLGVYLGVAVLASLAAGVYLDRADFVEPAREALVSDATDDQVALLKAEAEQALAAGTIAEMPTEEDLVARIPEGAVAAAVTPAAVDERATLDFLLRAFQIGIGLVVLLFLAVNAVRFARLGDRAEQDHQRLFVIFWLFLLAALFWMGFEQAGSSLNLFARDLTDRSIGGWEMPASWLQNVNPFFIIVLAPVFGSMWVWLAKRNANPSIPLKFAFGLFGLSVGFFVIAWGAANAGPGNLVSPAWLIVTYFFHTAGELALSPVGLSSMTKLAPKGRVGQMMGVWFIGAALGNLFAGLTAGQLETLAPDALFWNVALIVGGAGVVALLASPLVKRLMGDVE